MVFFLVLCGIRRFLDPLVDLGDESTSYMGQFVFLPVPGCRMTLALSVTSRPTLAYLVTTHRFR